MSENPTDFMSKQLRQVTDLVKMLNDPTSANPFIPDKNTPAINVASATEVSPAATNFLAANPSAKLVSRKRVSDPTESKLRIKIKKANTSGQLAQVNTENIKNQPARVLHTAICNHSATPSTSKITAGAAEAENLNPEITLLPASPTRSIPEADMMLTKMYEHQFERMTARINQLNADNFENWKLTIDDVHAIKAILIIGKIEVGTPPTSNRCVLCRTKQKPKKPKTFDCGLCKYRGYANTTYTNRQAWLTHNSSRLHRYDEGLEKLPSIKCPKCSYEHYNKNHVFSHCQKTHPDFDAKPHFYGGERSNSTKND